MNNIAIIDYGMGNLRSVQKALEKSGGKAFVTQDPDDLQTAEKIVLPGVGAMQPAMEKLTKLNFVPAIQESIRAGKPFLGICLGMQLLFERSSEGGDVAGLGILAGNVERFAALKVPHMGWNQIAFKNPQLKFWQGLTQNPSVYFCHSYYVRPKDAKIIAATTEYGIEFASAVAQDNILAVQFHPEKSQAAGLKILENFAKS